MSRRRRLWVPIALLGAALAVYWPVLAGSTCARRDFVMWAIGSRAVVREALLEGLPALWNPYIGLGASNLSNPQHAAFYPLHLLLVLAPPVLGLNLFYLLHVLICGAGGYALGRAVGARAAGAAAAALVTMLGGVTTSGWASGTWLLTAAWMPWCAAAAVRLGRRDATPGAVALLAAPLAMTALAGDPFQLARAAILALPLAVGAALQGGGPRPLALGAALQGGAGRRPVARSAGRWLAACALGLLLSAAAWLPALAFLGQTERHIGLPIGEAEKWSFHPVRLLELVAPGLLGDTRDPDGYLGARWALPGEPPVPWAYSAYLGAGVVLFATLALRRRDEARRALPAALACALAVGLVLALGRHTPVHRVARVLVPPLAFLRYPEKFLDIAATAAAALVALGVQRALEEPARAARMALFAALAFAAAALGARGLGAPQAPVRALATASACLAGMALALRLAAGRPRLGQAFVVAILGADLALAALPALGWTSARAIERGHPPVAPPARGAPPPRVYRDLGQSDWQSVPFEPRALVGTLVPNLGALYRIATLPGYEPSLPRRYRETWNALATRGSAALRSWSVHHALLARAVVDPDLRAVGTSPPATIYAVRDPLPRAYVTGLARYAPDRAPGDWLDEDVVAGRAAVVHRPGDAISGAPGRAGACSFLSYAREQVELHCTARRDALAVLVEADAPGWRVEIDGREAPVVRVNWILRGVRLGPGDHHVRFLFRPPGLAAGAGLSALGLLLCVAFVKRLFHWTLRPGPKPAPRLPCPS